VPPIWPAPMMPIFMFASYGWIAEATGGDVIPLPDQTDEVFSTHRSRTEQSYGCFG
jgi:hypothetical protein